MDSTSQKENDGAPERGLSPVLNTTKVDRKLLLQRKREMRKGGVKLAKKFKPDTPEDPKECTSLDLAEDIFSNTQAQCLLDSIEMLEQGEGDSKSMKPTTKPESPPERVLCERNVQVPPSNSVGFQTAAGKAIKVSEAAVKKHSNLFDDILNSSEGVSTRNKKYSFIGRSSSAGVTDEKSVPNKSGLRTLSDPCTVQKSSVGIFGNENFDDIASLGSAFKGFVKSSAVHSSDDPKTSKNVLPTTKESHIFAGENLDDIKTLHGNLQGFVKSSSVSGLKNEPSASEANSFGCESFAGIKASDRHCDLEKIEPERADSGFGKAKIFGGESFDDIKALGQDLKGFVKSSDVHTPKHETVVSGKRNIFAGENFDDLKPLAGSSKGFAKSSSLKNKPKIETVVSGRGIFGNENFDDIKAVSGNFKGFVRSSSLNSVGQKGLVKSRCVGMRKADIFGSENFDIKGLERGVKGFEKSSSFKSDQKELANSRNVFAGENFDDIAPGAGFGGFVKSSSFQDFGTEATDDFEASPEEFKGFSEAEASAANNIASTLRDYINGKTERSPKNTTKQHSLKRRLSFEEEEEKSDAKKLNLGFTGAAGSTMEISKSAVSKVPSIFMKFNLEEDLFISTSIDDSNKAQDMPNQESNSSLLNQTKSKFVNKQYSSPNLNGSFGGSARKKRLGVSSLKPIQIPKEKLERAKLIFDDIPQLSTSVQSYTSSDYTASVPTRNILPCSTPLKNPASFFMNSTIITPIKNELSSVAEATLEDADEENTVIGVNSKPFVLKERTKGNIDSWKDALQTEKELLDRKLKLIYERQEALQRQKHLLEKEDLDHRRKRQGVLLSKKLQSPRVRLTDLLSDCDTRPKIKELADVTSQNAVLFHFNCAQCNSATIPTADGSEVIPNSNNLVGLSEIEAAFRVMPGVEPSLIPRNWISNHYRWIVWKLVSYERFSADLTGVLTVDNVMQQLKYRYDREIDKCERPTLRKIMERDDVPQKRMVLCVSNILQNSDGQLELELTDGWYGVKATIDKALCEQVSKGRIRIGTKLVTCGAELLHCDGCHPLDATDLVRLKINCNSTRRVAWHVKLGYYQPNLEPFPVKLADVVSNGGLIGCIQVFIARVYPLKFVEKQGSLNVWRNGKAEERRAAEWEAERFKKIEEINEIIRKDYEQSRKSEGSSSKLNVGRSEIKSITCPEALYNMYEQSNDPESLQEMLSQSQLCSIMDYQRNMAMEREREIAARMKESLSTFPPRDVTPVLHMLIADAMAPRCAGMSFQVWRPADAHLQILEEGRFFNVFNVLRKRNGDFSSVNRTMFKPFSRDSTEFEKYRRSFVPISKMHGKEGWVFFAELDSVGIVVRVTVEQCGQGCWLSDLDGNLLYIYVNEGPRNCAIFDNLKAGQAVAVANLKLSEFRGEVVQAYANHSTVFSSYPQYKHLQESLSQISNNLPQDLTKFLKECDEKVSYYTAQNRTSSTMFTTFLDDSCDDATLTSSGYTSTDVAMSLIDIDKLR